MLIVISYNNPEPIFRQIMEQIKIAIAAGDLKENEKLPSIREMAQELKVSVITVKRAYTDLEAEGYLVTRPGLGSFVASISRTDLKEEKRNDIKRNLMDMIDSAGQYGITAEEIMDLLASIDSERKGKENGENSNLRRHQQTLP
jgi:GntR family transcriptional regulator